MKKLFLLLVLISSSVIFAQAPKGMVKIDPQENRFAASFDDADKKFENLYNGEFRKTVRKVLDTMSGKYSGSAEEAARLTNEKYAAEIAAFHKELERDLGNIRQIYLPVMTKNRTATPDHVQINEPILEKLLDNFYDGAANAKVNYALELLKLKKVLYVDADPYFLGEVSKDGASIYLNSELLKYEKLNWIIFYRQMGKLYGLKDQKRGHGIMSTHWELDQEHEDTAQKRLSRPHERKSFFDALAEEKPLKKKI